MEIAPDTQVTQPPLRARPPRKKSKFWRKLGVATLITVVGATAFATLTPQGRDWSRGLRDTGGTILKVRQNPNLIFDNVGDDHVNILLIGEDRSWKETEVFDKQRNKMVRWHVIDEKAPPRSDTMIVVSLDRSAAPNAIRMVSFPRDARVTYVDLDGDVHKRKKMNSVYSSGGNDPKMREQVLKQFFRDEMGLRIDRVARIRIEGFTELINKVGGLEIKVDGALEKDKRTGKLYRGPISREDSYGQWKVDLKPGTQQLNGEEAVGYARFRMDREGDSGRIRRQQQVMRALAKKITGLPLMQLPGAVTAAKEQLATDMSDEELASMALFAKRTGAETKISPLTIFGENARSGNKGDVIINKPDNIKLFSYIFGNSFKAENFLDRSPSTTRDELGVTNNRNPAAIETLRAAGILAPDAQAEPSAVIEAPVRGDEEN